MHRIAKLLAVPAVAGAMVLGGGQAMAQERPVRTAQTAPERPEHDVEAMRQRCLDGVESRLERVDRLQDAVSSSEHVTPAHEAKLDAQLAHTQAGLTRLYPQIRDEQDPRELRALCMSVVEDYRVYVLVTPRTLLTLGGDRGVAAAGKLDDAAGRIQTAIDEAASQGRDVTEAQAAVDSMRVNTATGRDAAASVPPAVLPLEPHDWPAARDTLASGRDTLRSAHESLTAAREDGRRAVEALRNS